MREVLSGFATIWVVIAVGWLLAHRRVLDDGGQDTLSRVSFFVGSPALLFLMLSEADLTKVFARNVVATVLATCLAALLHLVLVTMVLRGRRRPPRAELILGTACACYVNSANLGLPIAAFVLKDATWVAPVLLLQVGFLQPLALTLLDADSSRAHQSTHRLWANLSLPFRNPMTVGTLLGLAANLLHLRLPDVVHAPVSLLAALSVPGMLLAFGMSLRRGPLPGRTPQSAQAVIASVVKLVAHPLIAWGLAAALHLPPATTLAVVVMAALPTAQNVFLWSTRHREATTLVRDVIVVTTFASLGTITLFTALVH